MIIMNGLNSIIGGRNTMYRLKESHKNIFDLWKHKLNLIHKKIQ